MSYMRSPYYVWSSGEHVHIDDLTMDQESFDELCIMGALKILLNDGEEGFRKIAERAYRNHGGNISCDGVAQYLGEPGVLSGIRMKLRQILPDPQDQAPA